MTRRKIWPPTAGSLPGKRLQKIRRETILLARAPALNFFELAGLIADLYAADPGEIRDLPQDARMSRRRLYYLLEVGRLIRNSTITKAEAERVGWTKLQIIAQHVGQLDEVGEAELRALMELADDTRVRALSETLRRGSPPLTRAAVFHLTESDRMKLDQSLLTFGAKHGRTGLVNKEAAIMQLSEAAMKGRALSNR